MNSSEEKACSMIDSMPHEKVKAILKAYIRSSHSLAEQILREHSRRLDPSVLDSIKRRILSALNTDWESMDDDYDGWSHRRYGSYDYGYDPLEQWNDLVVETIDTEINKLLDSHHPDAAWEIVCFVLSQEISDEYDQASNVYEHCIELYKKIYQSSATFAPVLFDHCLNQLINREINLSSLFGYDGVGYCFTDKMLDRLGECLQEDLQQYLAQYETKDSISDQYPEALMNMMLYYRVRGYWEKYDLLVDRYWKIFKSVRSTAIDDARNADRTVRLIELYERRFQDCADCSDWDYRQFIAALEKTGNTKQAAYYLGKLLESYNYFPDFKDLQKLKSWVEDPKEWAQYRKIFLSKPDRQCYLLDKWASRERAHFYVLEDMYDELWALVEKADYVSVRDFFTVLAKNDTTRAIELIERLLSNVRAPTGNHQYYRQMADDLVYLQKVNGGRPAAQRVLKLWRSEFSRRRLLWEALQVHGISRK